MPDQSAKCSIGRAHFFRSIGGKALRRSGKLLLITILLLLPASHAEQSPPPGQTPPEQAVSEIENYIKEIQREEGNVNQALQAVYRSSSAPSDFSAQWLAAIAPRGAGSLPLFSRTRSVLTSWVTSIRDGSDRYPPLNEIRTQMAEWRGRVSRLKDALGRVPGLEERRNKTRTRLSGLKPESSEWQVERREENRIDDEIRATLSAAQSEAESSLKIPPPISPSDRTRSPFDGPVNPGLPTSLWIWTEKASAPIGDTINTQVGLANEAGPNCKADKSYSVKLDCQGCTINNPEITIREGASYSQTNIRVTDPAAVLKAGGKDLKRNQVNLKGCASAETVWLVATALPDLPTRGPADGVTRLKYDLVFQDSKGQPATNGLRKQISVRLDGVGTIEIDDKQAGAIRSAKDGFLVPPGECLMHQAVFSNLVGQAIVQAEFRRTSANPLTLTFDYAFPRLDIISMLTGALLGCLAHFLSRKGPKISFWRSAIFSLCGSIIGVVLGYLTVLNQRPLHNSFLVAGAFTLVGGILGLSMARLLVKLTGGGAGSS